MEKRDQEPNAGICRGNESETELKSCGGRNPSAKPKKYGLLVGGSGLIGGFITTYFKARADAADLRAPNSKKLNLRKVDDIRDYFRTFRPDFIINAAISPIDADAQMAYEVNYLGSINLARAALALKIPYIHISSAATLPDGENLTEDDRLDLAAPLSNYAKSKLMTEISLQQMHAAAGLDYTMLRLAMVYGEHDHKIQGMHRLLFTIADEALPFMITRRGVRHSYTNAKKLPFFVEHIIEHRQEFSGQLLHFADPEPVEFSRLILTMKSYLGLKIPREIYIPYGPARWGQSALKRLISLVARFGVEIRLPSESMFLEHFYRSQTLSSARLQASSFVDPFPQATVFTELPGIIEYYLARWQHLNLFSARHRKPLHALGGRSAEFLKQPHKLLEKTHAECMSPLDLF